MEGDYLVPQIRRALALLVGGLQSQPEQGGELDQSIRCCDAVLELQLQFAVRGAMQRPNGRLVHGECLYHRDVHQLPTLGVGHVLDPPRIEIRPEVDVYHSVDGPAFNGNTESNNVLNVRNGPGCAASGHFAGSAVGQCPNKSTSWIGMIDAIVHF
jgi:hypothetical protein